MAKKPFDYDGDGKPNTKKDKALADEDLNNDGFINKKDESLRQDTLSNEIIGRDYQTASRLLGSDPFISSLFEQAIAERWEPARFEAAIKNSDWYGEVGGEYARKAWFSKTLGGPDWEDQMTQARDAIQRQAAAMGANLADEDIERFAERYLFEGWFNAARQGLMMDALSSKIESDRGGQIAVRDTLATLAMDNGVTVSDQWFDEASQSIARGDSTQADQEMWIREQAAQMHPLYADKIRAGLTVKSLASPYLQRMGEILELNADQIGLDDPYIREALGGVDAEGNPKAISFTDFETKLRNDPRWENTKNGKNTLMNMTTRMMKDWGFVD